MKTIYILFIAFFTAAVLNAQSPGWYYTHETNSPEDRAFVPLQRLEYKIINTLDIERKNCPVVIKREGFPVPDIHELWVTVIDPSLEPYEGPSEEVLLMAGGHQLRAEVNGAAIYQQLDDLNKDGVWDELFFQTDLQPNEEKTIYIYIGENDQGWNTHYTHANVGSYVRHQVPFWESENVGWKIWFANACDVYGKRKPVLMSQHLYMENLDGYAVSAMNPDWGSDIQSVDNSMGGGAICLFEYPENPDSASSPRFTPVKRKIAPGTRWPAGQISDTRYSYELIANGPIRSIIKINTRNWNSGEGSYDVSQYYTAYAHQSYSTCKVVFDKFLPKKAGVKMGCGIRKKPGKESLIKEDGIIISSGPEEVRDPENIDDRESWMVDFIGKAIVVKEKYKPEYHFVPDREGNHTFRIMADEDNQFEYAIFAAWSQGAVYNNEEVFKDYVMTSYQEINNPVEIEFIKLEEKSE